MLRFSDGILNSAVARRHGSPGSTPRNGYSPIKSVLDLHCHVPARLYPLGLLVTPPAVSQQIASGNPYNCAGQHPFHSRTVRTFVANERRSAVPLAPLRRRSTLTPVKYEKLDGLGSRWCQSTRIGSGDTLRTHQQLLGVFLTPSCVSERLTRRMNSSSLYD
jgi:hypothetical protein